MLTQKILQYTFPGSDRKEIVILKYSYGLHKKKKITLIIVCKILPIHYTNSAWLCSKAASLEMPECDSLKDLVVK